MAKGEQRSNKEKKKPKKEKPAAGGVESPFASGKGNSGGNKPKSKG